MDPSSNFSNYRTALRGATQRSETAHSSQEKVGGGHAGRSLLDTAYMSNVSSNQVVSFLQIVIPFFSLLIKDIYFLNEGCASSLTNGHINFEVSPQFTRLVDESGGRRLFYLIVVWEQTLLKTLFK